MSKTFDYKDSIATISNHYIDLINSARTMDVTALARIRQYLKPQFLFSGHTAKHQSWWRWIWSAYIKYTVWIVAPLKVDSASIAMYRLPTILPFLWLELIALVYSIVAFARITEVYQVRPSTIPQTEAIIFVNVFWIVITLITPAIYNYGAEFFFNKKNRLIWRVVFAVFFFITITIILVFPGYELQMLQLESQPATMSSALHHYVANSESIALTLFFLVVILVPALIYISLLFVDIVLWVIWAGSTI